MRPVERLESGVAFLGQERLQGGLGFGRVAEIDARQRPPRAAQRRCGGMPDRLPQPGDPRELGQGMRGSRARGSETADRELCVRQHRAHLELEHGVVGGLGELGCALRTRQVLGHVAREPAQASVGREEECLASAVLESLGDRARVVEEVPSFALLDSCDAPDLEQRDARRQRERHRLTRFGQSGQERHHLAAVPDPIRRVAARDAPARALVPACGLEILARFLEVMGKERGVRRRRGTVHRQQPSRDGGVRPAPPIQKLRTIGDLVRERMSEGELTGRLRRSEELGYRETPQRCGELGCGQIDDDPQQFGRHVSSDHSRSLEHVLVPRRKSIDARREDGLNGLGQRDLLDRSCRPVLTTCAVQRTALDE